MNQLTPSEITEEQLASLKQDMEVFVGALLFRSIMDIHEALGYMIREYGISDLSILERLLRDMNSSVYMVAVPKSTLENLHVARLPGINANLPYALAIFLNEDQTLSILRRLKVSTKTNLLNLANCGLAEPLLS